VQAADALAGAPLGRRVLVISEDDGPAPLSVADHLAGLGHQVTLVFQTPGPAPLVGKYSIGGMLRRLDEEGVVLVANARVVAISEAGADATLAHSSPAAQSPMTVSTRNCAPTTRTSTYSATPTPPAG
jgi:hypothetical protein